MYVFPWPPLQYSSFPLSWGFPCQVLLCKTLLTLISISRYYYVYHHLYLSLDCPTSLSGTKHFFFSYYHHLPEILCLRFPISTSDFLPLGFNLSSQFHLTDPNNLCLAIPSMSPVTCCQSLLPWCPTSAIVQDPESKGSCTWGLMFCICCFDS